MCVFKTIHKLNLPVLFLLVFFLLSCKWESRTAGDNSEKPDSTRFTTVVLEENLDEPVMFQILNDNRILVAERKGKIKVLNPANHQIQVIADIPVSVGYYSETGEELSSSGEDGMLGAILDPGFNKNHWIYLFYSPKSGKHRSILTRYEWKGNAIDTNSKKILLEVPNQRVSCCHLGGGMLFDSDGNLLITTGDNTPNDGRGYAPLDERPGRERFDSQRSSGNTNDLRGKILRIHPEPDGTYTIPDGNLFPKDLPKTRPEIYTMGNRNPWRLSIDSKTGWLYWGEVGPGGIVDSVGMGPKSYDEFNQARKAGNFGWPLLSANNQAYWRYDYELNKPLEKFDSLRPLNRSPHNTGLTELPPAQPAFIWYPQDKSVEFPLLGSGSNSAVGGPIYHLSDFKNPKRPFPSYYEGKWFITDWVRGWIMVVSFNKDGFFESMERFLPELDLIGPIDMKFGPDGDLYILEYGRKPYAYSPEARIVKIEYNKGNRKPIAGISSDKKMGAVPLTVNFNSSATKDYDNDKLTYNWTISSQDKITQTFAEPNPVATFSVPGIYRVTLSVKDPAGATDTTSTEIIAGNDAPNVKITFHNTNKSFFFLGDTINYSVDVSDKEDGSLAGKQISPSKVSVSADYFNQDIDVPDIKGSLEKVNALTSVQSVVANYLMSQSDCRTCHSVDTKSAGPSFTDISKRYQNNDSAGNYLVKKIILGGSGIWGEMEMPPHPTLTENDATAIVNYILHLGKDHQNSNKSLPVTGRYIVKSPRDEKNKSAPAFGSSDKDKFIFRASYTDNGSKEAPQQSAVDILVLRNPLIPVIESDKSEAVEWRHSIIPSQSTVIPEQSGAYLMFKQIDLTGIGQIELMARGIPEAGSDSAWSVEIRTDSPTGELIGKIHDIVRQKNVTGKNTAPFKTDLTPINGMHDLYLVFINKMITGPQKQIQVRAVKFLQH